MECQTICFEHSPLDTMPPSLPMAVFFVFYLFYPALAFCAWLSVLQQCSTIAAVQVSTDREKES